MGHINVETREINSCIESKVIELANKMNIDLSQHLKEGTLEFSSLVEEIKQSDPKLAIKIAKILN